LPKAQTIKDFKMYVSLRRLNQEKKDEISVENPTEIKKPITFSF
jgi:hypothetical protein